MKKITKILASLLLLTSFAFAVELISLKANMKQTGSLLKQVIASASDASKNVENSANTQKMIDLFTAVREQTPDNGSFAEYQSLIDQEIVLFKDLKTAFINNNTTDVLATIQKINVLKKEGHDKFK